jgi:hypothetical protein
MTRAAQTNPHCNQEVLPRRGAHPLAYDMWQIGLSPGERTSGRSSERDSITLRTAGGQKSDAKIPPLALTLQNLRQFLPKVSLTALRGSGLWRAFDAKREARAHLPAWRAIPSVRAEGPQLRPGRDQHLQHAVAASQTPGPESADPGRLADHAAEVDPPTAFRSVSA